MLSVLVNMMVINMDGSPITSLKYTNYKSVHTIPDKVGRSLVVIKVD
jgi:hypothetical protein